MYGFGFHRCSPHCFSSFISKERIKLHVTPRSLSLRSKQIGRLDECTAGSSGWYNPYWFFVASEGDRSISGTKLKILHKSDLA
ncbi:hypothetical protein H6G17_00485 [Chroococcidiopsis sp. FACHB-1243]|uniref:hypothetical protein n=1 Tax=unclassified Chroococcidiopsis TaxID=2646205 RepID=UPI0011B1CBEF|nr:MULTISPECIES: hypothetical protein [unclassified Chroococcidiopsis]MBD2303998.1 hypothetical protein [Chroococcidiopsis sp. [FACHB-1243]]